MAPKLRYEFLLPTCYNDGRPIESSKYREAKDKIVAKFGGVSLHPNTVQGTWIHPDSRQAYNDNCCRFEVSVDKTDEAIAFFEAFKQEMKILFDQHEIYMLYTEIMLV